MGLAVRLLHHLRRRHILSPLSLASISTPLQFPPVEPRLPAPHASHGPFLGGAFSGRSFSWSSNSRNSDDTRRSDEILESDVGPDTSWITESTQQDTPGITESTHQDTPGITESTQQDTPWIIESTQLENASGSEIVTEKVIWDYPIEWLTGFLDGYHDLTGLPWWIVIASCTVAMRVSLFPLLRLQAWKVATFILWVTCIRTMCLNHHPGFETGGILWFQDLTITPHGAGGCILPFVIASLHYTNVQITFKSVQLAKVGGMFGQMVKYYKLYLELLTIPSFIVGVLIPQGSLVFCTTNVVYSLFQNLALNNEHARMKLGMPVIKSRRAKSASSSENPARSMIAMQQEAMRTLSHDQLLDISLEEMAAGKYDRSLQFLNVALEKNPDSVTALVAMSQRMFSKMAFQEAIRYAERALSKMKDEDPHLVLALFVAGLSYKSLGNSVAAINHLKRIPNLSVPEKIMEKACYYQALAVLGSFLFEEGKASEAIVYIRAAASYDPSFDRLVKECEEAIERAKYKF